MSQALPNEPRRKKRKWPRRMLFTAAVLLVFAWGLVEVLLPHWLRGRMQEALREQCGEAVRIGGIELNPLRGEAILDHVAIPTPAGFTAVEFASIDRVVLRIAPSSLLGDVLVVERLKIERPQIHLERLPGGRRNIVELFPDLFAEKESTPEKKVEKPEPEKATDKEKPRRKRSLEIQRIEIKDAAFRGTDNKSKKYGGSAELAWDDVRVSHLMLSGDGLRGEQPIGLRIDNLKLRGPEGYFREPRLLWIDEITAEIDPAALANGRLHIPRIRIQQPIIEEGVDSRRKETRGRTRRIIKAMFPAEDEDNDGDDSLQAVEIEPAPAMDSAPAGETPAEPAREEGMSWKIDELELAMGYWRETWWTPDGWREHWVDGATLAIHGLGSGGADEPFALQFSAVINDARGRIEATAGGRPFAPPGERNLHANLSVRDVLITPLRVKYDIEDDEEPTSESGRLENARVNATLNGTVENELVEATVRLHFDELRFRPSQRSIWKRLASIGEDSDSASWWTSTIERLRPAGQNRTVELAIAYEKPITGRRMAPAIQGIWGALMEEASRQSARLAQGEPAE